MIRKIHQIKCYLIGDTKANKGKEVIEELFRKLSTFKSAGPDYLQPRALILQDPLFPEPGKLGS